MNADERNGAGASSILAAVLLALLASPLALHAAQGRPFLLWTKADLAAIRKRIETQEWAKRKYQALPKGKERGAAGLPGLLRYAAMGDKATGEAEKKLLLSAIAGGRGKSDYVNPIRYDLLYDDLTPDERARVEKAFRTYVADGIASMAQRNYNRWNWLPNLAYPWYLTAHLMAASLRDEALARRIFASKHGLKWYFDEYLSDLGFYNEEFGKMFATPGAMLLWCRACERMGWDDMGYGYVGRRPPDSDEQPATMRGHIESLLRIGLPRVDLGTSRPHYPRLAMGDAMQSQLPAYGFQHALVPGYLTDGLAGRRGREWYHGLLPQRVWFEIAHAKWPDAGFGYFLAQMRAPDETHYYPTLHFGLDPIDPKAVKPPPAPSGVYPGRGLVVLRADEGGGYWEGPAPAVGMRLATPYAHHIQDCFALTGFYAFNRPIFLNRKHASNYSGVDPGYSNSARSHCTVIVDFAEPKTIGRCDVRHDFTPQVKFVAVRAKGIYDGVDQTRALFLTREYLLDVFHLESDRPRHYQWIMQTFGHLCPDRPELWTPSRDLVGSLFDLGRERSITTDNTWYVTAVQTSGGANRHFSGFGERWFDRRVGVKTLMVGEEGTTAYHAWSPVVQQANGQWRGRDRFCYGEDEPAAGAIVVSRRKAKTSFVALHEPFPGNWHIGGPLLVAQDANGMVVKAWDVRLSSDQDLFLDYLMVQLHGKRNKPITLGEKGTVFTFAGHAYVRTTRHGVEAVGDLRGMVIPLYGPVPDKLRLNGELVKTRVVRGNLVYGTGFPESSIPDRPPGYLQTQQGAISVKWKPATGLCLPAGGSGKALLHLHHTGMCETPVRLELLGSGGLTVRPDTISWGDFRPGGEKRVEVEVNARAAAKNSLCQVDLRLVDPRGWGRHAELRNLQPEALLVANGVCVERSQFWPADFAETIYSPRYVAKVYYMDSTAAQLLLDPAGYRRSDASGSTYPMLVRHGTDDRGRKRWIAQRFPKFPYFISRIVPGPGGSPALAYEGGRHAHGTTGGLEHWFTEDWIVCRFRDARPGERIALDWLPRTRQSLDRTILGRRVEIAREKMPGKVMLAGRDGKVHDLGSPDDLRKGVKPPKGVEDIAAVLVRPHGYEYGSATFYPPDSRSEGGYVTQPGDKPTAFTYCKDDEFAGFVQKWLANPPTGVARKEETDAYNGAFMPHLEKPR